MYTKHTFSIYTKVYINLYFIRNYNMLLLNSILLILKAIKSFLVNEC